MIQAIILSARKILPINVRAYILRQFDGIFSIRGREKIYILLKERIRWKCDILEIDVDAVQFRIMLSCFLNEHRNL